MSLDSDKSKIPSFIPQGFGLDRTSGPKRSGTSSVNKRAANLGGDRFSELSPSARQLHQPPVRHARNNFEALQLFDGDDARPTADPSAGRALGRALSRAHEMHHGNAA